MVLQTIQTIPPTHRHLHPLQIIQPVLISQGAVEVSAEAVHPIVGDGRGAESLSGFLGHRHKSPARSALESSHKPISRYEDYGIRPIIEDIYRLDL